MEYDLKLSQQQVQVLLQALGELPLKYSVNTFAAIQEQVARQDEERVIEMSGTQQENIISKSETRSKLDELSDGVTKEPPIHTDMPVII